MTGSRRKSSLVSWFTVVRTKRRTVPVSKRCPRVGHIVDQLVVNEAQAKDEEVEENPDGEKQTTATFVNHPDLPLVDESLGLEWSLGSGIKRVNALKGLQTPSLGLVSLEVSSSVGIILLKVRMLVQVGNLTTVGKIESRRPLELAEVGGHRELWDGYGTRWGRPALASGRCWQLNLACVVFPGRKERK